ncbi:hypothetical protein B0T14DRAFT_439678 [Immersiella caudata]|uniref:Uncharacterized protein n=1 Tax=Immersiella caudata TaxID=314043 RepID=A0AA39TY31_9PEZI|nr:hypothetical protein B0T14DRAFT_439678 [Immersiella caudata]
MSQSLAKQCNEVKERYDTCFLKWYSEKYLRGAANADSNECSALFKEYSACLHGALKDRGIDKLLEDAREDNKENDATFMGRKKCKRGYSHSQPCLLTFQTHRIITRIWIGTGRR